MYAVYSTIHMYIVQYRLKRIYMWIVEYVPLLEIIIVLKSGMYNVQ